MKLNEVAKRAASEDKKWLTDNFIFSDIPRGMGGPGPKKKMTPTDDGYDIVGNLRGREHFDGHFKIRIANVYGDVSIRPAYKITIDSLEDFPRVVEDRLSFNSNCSFSSFKGMPRCGSIIWDNTITSIDLVELLRNVTWPTDHIYAPTVKNLVGISEFANVVKLEILELDVSADIQGGLGLLLLTGLKRLDFRTSLPSPALTAFKEIIEPCIGKPEMIFDCQEALITAGMEHLAQL